LSGQAIARENLVKIVAAYQEATKKPLSAISRRFYGKASFLQDFLHGEEVTISYAAMDRMIDKFRDEWPAGVIWPRTRGILMNFRRQRIA
jgi:hypothetical protein